MGSICSKDSPEQDKVYDNEPEKELNKSAGQLVAPAPSKREDLITEHVQGSIDGPVGALISHANGASFRPLGYQSSLPHGASVRPIAKQSSSVAKLGSAFARKAPRLLGNLPNGAEGDQVIAGWPSWLASVAGDAIKGWVPRRAESFEKLGKIGQGTYSSVYKSRDLETGKIVAMKKVKFVNMDPESVRFMAREIFILRQLDHPNVMKLEGLVTSRVSCSLYLVFEYMEHDLAGLAAAPGIKFTEPQIKCYMQQLFRGLEHCHSRGVLHRDIKGANLLLDNNGVLKIGDFGLAAFFEPDKTQSLTSRVVTLWYRAPELLLGATEYGAAIDLWSCGCILAELFAGKPIMPGRTEVEQMHKIFKLCGSPSEDYWQITKFPLATSFKPQQPYNRCVAETFKNFPPAALALINTLLAIEPQDRGSVTSALRSEFFQTEPLPCDPSSLPKYPPSKEFDAKLRDEETRRKKTEDVRGQDPEVRRGHRNTKAIRTPEFNTDRDIRLQGQTKPKTSSHTYNPQEDGGSGFPMEPRKGTMRNGFFHPSSMIHPSSAVGSTWDKPAAPIRKNAELRTQRSQMPQAVEDFFLRKDDKVQSKEFVTANVQRKNRIVYSGPLVPPGGNIEDMLKEHERLIQQAFRKARVDKARTNQNYG